jgi:predicted Zn-dependent protease
MGRTLLVIALALPISLYSQKTPKQADVRIQNTPLTRDQELQIGKQFAGQVEREMEVIHNAEIEQWLTRLAKAWRGHRKPMPIRTTSSW